MLIFVNVTFIAIVSYNTLTFTYELECHLIMNISDWRFGLGRSKSDPTVATFMNTCAQFLFHNQFRDKIRAFLSSYLKFSKPSDEVSRGGISKGGGVCGKDSEEVGVPTFF